MTDCSTRLVYDSDVRMKPILKAIAIQYVSEYNGNFDMMIGAKEYLHDAGTLADSMVRPVLNTLRREGRPEYEVLQRTLRAALNEPADRPVVTLDGSNVVPLHRDTRGTSAPRRTQQNRPVFIRYSGKELRAQFATTLHRAQKPVYHLLHGTCDVEWAFPSSNKRPYNVQYHLPREFRILADRLCGGYPSGLRFWDHIPTDEEAWPGNKNNTGNVLTLCVSCRNRSEDAT